MICLDRLVRDSNAILQIVLSLEFGRTYGDEIRFENGTLEPRGRALALAIFRRTQTWCRPKDVIAAID